MDEDESEQGHDDKRLKQETKNDCIDECSNPNRRKKHESQEQEQPGRSPKARRTVADAASSRDTSTPSSSKGGEASKGNEGSSGIMQSRANFKDNLMQRIQDQAEQANKRRRMQPDDEPKDPKEFRNKSRGSGAALGKNCGPEPKGEMQAIMKLIRARSNGSEMNRTSSQRG